MGLTRRFEDWPVRLADFIASRQAVAFVWGATDCALFAADWVQAATGIDHAAAFRGRYRSASGASRALRRFGRGSLAATATAALGPELDNPLLAQRGDVVLVDTGLAADGPAPVDLALGVCLGATVACVYVRRGLVQLPIARALRAWRV